jgi:hypothetical protein
MNVKTASLNTPLDKEIFMHLPEGYDQEDSREISTDILRLKKALYGLKQASREWNCEIDQYLHEILGFCRREVD